MNGTALLRGTMLVLMLWSPAPAATVGFEAPTDSAHRSDPYIRKEPEHVSVVKQVIPGLIGAVVGGYFGGSFGVIGKIVGSAAGWYVGNKVGQMLFPKRWYDDYDHYPWYYRQQSKASGPAGFGSFGYATPVYGPLAPALDGRLTALREEWTQALAVLQTAARGTDENAKRAAQTAFDQVDQRYRAAKQTASSQ